MHRQQTLTGETLQPRGDNEVCSRCVATDNLEVHHIQYIPEKITTLCRSCHKHVHNCSSSPFEPTQDANELFNAPTDDCDAPTNASVTVKEINNNPYFYWNWRDEESIKSEFICALSDAAEHPLYTGPSITDTQDPNE